MAIKKKMVPAVPPTAVYQLAQFRPALVGPPIVQIDGNLIHHTYVDDQAGFFRILTLDRLTGEHVSRVEVHYAATRTPSNRAVNAPAFASGSDETEQRNTP